MYPASVHAQSSSGDTDAATAMCPAGFDALNGTQDVDTFVMGNATYAVVASYDDSGVQLIRIGDDGSLSAVSSVFNGGSSGDTFFGGLAGARGIDAFSMGNRTYAAVASWASSAIQLIRIHENGTMTAADEKSYFDDNSLVIYSAADVDTFDMNGTKYAAVSSYWGHGVQLFHIRENGTLSAVSNATNTKDGFAFDGAEAIDVFAVGNRTYAAVASQRNSAIQLIRIHENGTMTAAGAVSDGGWDGQRYFDELWGPRAVNTFATGDATYAIVASSWDHGVQLIRVYENGTMTAAGSATDNPDGAGPFDTLYWPAGVDTFDMDGDTYAIVSAFSDDGVQLIRVDDDGELISGGSIGGNGTLSHDLDGAVGISAFSLGDDPYAIVASYNDDAVQVVGISGDGSLRYVSSASDGDGGDGECPVEARLGGPVPSLSPADRATDGGPVGFDELDGARAVDAFDMGGETYVIAASGDDSGVQLIRIDYNGSLSAAGTASDGVGGFDELGGARAVDAFGMGGDRYAIVASWDDSGVQLIRIDENGTMVPADSATDDAGGFWTLEQASDVDTFDMGGDRYALAASYWNSGVQLIRVHENGTLSAVGSATHLANGFDALRGPRAVAAFDMGGDAYAVVASELSDGVQLIRVHENGTMAAAGSVFNDPQGPDSRLDGPHAIDAFDVGGNKYAIVASPDDRGVQLIRIHDNGTLSRAGSAADPYEFEADFATPDEAYEADFAPGQYGRFRIALAQLEGASGVDTLVIGDRTYAIVASAYDEDATLLRVHENGTLAPVPGGAVTGGGGGGSFYDFDGAAGIGAFGVGNRTYAVVASYNDDAVQVVRVGGDGRLSAGPSVSDSTGGFLALDYAEAVDTFVMGNDTYAITASRQDGVQLIRMHENGTMSAAGSIPQGDGVPGALRAPNTIDAFDMGNRARAVATLFGTGVQLIDVHENGTIGLAGASGGGGGMARIQGATAADVFSGCGITYAVVAAKFNDAVHLVRVHDDGRLSVSASATKLDGGFGDLYSPSAVDAFDIGGQRYALVTLFEERVREGGTETIRGNGVLMIRINACSGAMTAVASALHGTGGYRALSSPDAVDVFRAGSNTYAMVASSVHGSAQLIRVQPGGVMSPAGHAVHDPEDAGGFDALESASDIDAFSLAGNTYAMLPGSIAGAAQLIRVSENGTLFPAGSIRGGDGGDFALFGASAVSAFEMGNHTYVVAASSLDNAVQLIRMAPSVGGVDSPAEDGAYGVGAVVDITVRLFGRVNVTEPLELRLNSGGAAGLHSGNGTAALTFRYEVAEGENAADLDYDGADALSGSGTIADALGIAAFRMLPEPGSTNSLGGQRDIEIDTMRPLVRSVSSPTSPDAYGTGERIEIHVEFSETVYVTGRPTLGLETGEDDAQALYGSGGSTSTLVFLYHVRGGDVSADLEYAGDGALGLAGGTITDRAGNNANLALPDPRSAGSLGGSGIEVDGTSPSVVSVSSPNATRTYGTGERIAIHVEFTGNVYVTGRPILELETGGGDDGQAAYFEGNGTDTLVFVYHVRGGDRSANLGYTRTDALELAGGAIRSRAGGDGILDLPDPRSASSLFNSGIAVDGTRPSVLSASSPNATGAYRAGDTIAIHVRFTEPVDVAGDPVLGLETGGDGAQAMYISGSGTATLVFVYQVMDGDVSADLEYAGTGALVLGEGGTIRSGAGNDAVLALPDLGSAGSLAGSSDIEIDTVRPSAASVLSPNATGAYRAGDTIAIHVRFTEPVYVAGSPVLGLETGGDGAQAMYISGSGTATLVFAYMVRDGDASADLEYAGTGALDLGGSGGAIADRAGNDAVLVLPDLGSADSLAGSSDIEIDTVRPSVLSVSSPNSTGTYGTGERIAIHVRFTEPVYVAGTPALGLETGAQNESAQAAYSGGSGTATLVFAYIVMDGDVSADLEYAGAGALDLGGGGGSIADRAGNDAVLVLPAPGSAGSLAGSADIEIDTSMVPRPPPPPPPGQSDAPEPASVSVLRRAGGDPLSAPATYSAGDTIVVGVRFTAPVAVADASDGAPHLELRTGSSGARAAYAAGSGTATLEFAYEVRGGDMTDRLSYAGPGALALNGSSIAAAAGSGEAASVVLPRPGEPGSLSHADSPAVRIEPLGRPVLDIGVLDEAGPAGIASRAASMAAAVFNEQQGSIGEALLVRVSAHDAGTTAGSAAAALRAAHSSGAGPSVYVGPSTDRGLHAAMPYVAENGIVLVSAGSTAPSLAAGGDTVFRLLPSDRLEADALARHASSAAGGGAELMYAVLENATYGAPSASGSLEDTNIPPPQGAFAHGFDEAFAYSAVPSLSGTIAMGGAAGSYEAAAAAEALDAAVGSAGGAPAAVVYLGSPGGLAALAEASAGYTALASAPWFASSLSAGSVLLEGGGAAAGFAAQAGLSAAQWSVPSGGPKAGGIDPLLPAGADAGARHRAYAAYDAVFLLGTAAATGADDGGATTDAADIADGLPGTAAEYSGALGDIALDYAGDLWVPAKYDLWTVSQPGGAGSAAEWSQLEGELDGERACSITLTRAKIDYGPIDSGQTSRPHLQTIVNTGQLPFARVDLTATPWHVDSPGACRPGDSPSLPVGLSEIRTEVGGLFSDLAGSGTVLAQGLGAGGQAPLWYRLSLVGYADLPQAQITQCATYVVRCS